MIRIIELTLRASLACCAIMILAPVALAHCFPDQFTPAAAGIMTTPPSQVTVHFDNPYDPASSTVRVLSENGDVVSGERTPVADDRTLTVPLKALTPGQYFVKWRAVSKDGDHTMGAYSFTVKGSR